MRLVLRLRLWSSRMMNHTFHNERKAKGRRSIITQCSKGWVKKSNPNLKLCRIIFLIIKKGYTYYPLPNKHVHAFTFPVIFRCPAEPGASLVIGFPLRVISNFFVFLGFLLISFGSLGFLKGPKGFIEFLGFLI